MILSGWGRYPRLDCRVAQPQTTDEVLSFIRQGPLIARGAGRSYGDSAGNVALTVDMQGFHQLLAFDPETGLLTAGAGVQLQDIVTTFVPRGWFLPVTPGTSYVTVGGAIASDVHGKNHHVSGTFGQHVSEITLMLGTGEVTTASASRRSDLFHATCGGMGLTGIILSATLKLMPIRSSHIQQSTLKAKALDEVCELFEQHAGTTYSVAWIDGLARGKDLGRSVFLLGEHADDDHLEIKIKTGPSVPFDAPSFLLSSWSVRAFNRLYYARLKNGSSHTVPLQTYFYALDAIGHWNRLYGKQGFVQYQFAVPKTEGVANMRKILTRISDSGLGSFLAVLKLFGEQNANLLSFPFEGYTLALDFKMTDETRSLLRELDDMVVDMGGRIYLTKDALMSEETFKACYPNWKRFEAVREAHGALGRFSSNQSRRLGLR